MANSWEILQRQSDDILISGLKPTLRDSIDRLLARGVSAQGVLDYVRLCARRAAAGDPNRGQLTVLAVEAYLERRHGRKRPGGLEEYPR